MLDAPSPPLPDGSALAPSLGPSHAAELRAALEHELTELIDRQAAIAARVASKRRQLEWLDRLLGSQVNGQEPGSAHERREDSGGGTQGATGLGEAPAPGEAPAYPNAAGEALEDGPATQAPAADRDPGPTAPESPSGTLRARVLDTPVARLGLSRRSENCLRNGKLHRLRDVAAATDEELLGLRSFGMTCLRDVKRVLAEYGLDTGTRFIDRADGGVDEVPAGILPGEPSVEGTGGAPATSEAVEAPLTTRLPEDVLAEWERLSSLPEVARTIPGFDRMRELAATPLGRTAELWGLLVSDAVAYFGGLVRLAARVQNGGRVDPREEILLAVARGPDKDWAYAMRYFGLDGEPGQTLEAIGVANGVTRERVRQRVERFRRQVLAARPPLPFCEAALTALDPTRPMALAEWHAAVPSPIRPEDPSALRVLKILAEDWKWVPAFTWSETGTVLLVAAKEGRERELTEFESEARRAVRRYLPFGAVSPSMAAPHDDALAARLRTVLRASSRWEPLARDWFVLRNARGCSVGSRAHQVLDLLAPLSIADLRYAMRREMRRRRLTRGIPLPPRAVFRRVLKNAGCIVPRGTDEVRLRRPGTGQPSSATDRAILSAFATSPVATVYELDAAVQARGLSFSSSRVSSTFSPLLRRVEYGVYTLLGREVSDAYVAAARARVRAHAGELLVGHEVEPSGLVTVRYSLGNGTPPPRYLLQPGYIANGLWCARDACGTSMNLTVRDGEIDGLSPIARRAIAAGAGELVVRFDPGHRDAEIWW